MSLSTRTPKRALLLGFLIYLLLLGLGTREGPIEDGIITAVHDRLDKEALDFIASTPTPKQRFHTAAMQDIITCGISPNTTCSAYSSSVELVSDASTRICEHVAGKRIVFVGPLTTYYLHDIWLEALESHDGHSLSCPGAEFCIFHHICFPGRNASSYLNGRKQLFPKNKELQETRSAVLQYALSTSLIAHPNKTHDLYTQPTVDRATGVRMRNYFWLRKAQKANILVLGLPPVSAPPWTYAKYLGKRNESYLNGLLPIPWKTSALAQDLVAQALNATFSSFLPSLRLALRAIDGDSQIRKSLIVWHGHWPLDPVCTNSGLPKRIPSITQFWSAERASVDPWTFYYNFQIHIQDRLLPKILPSFDILYLPLSIAQNAEYLEPSQGQKDCIRQGKKALETVFFSALFHVLELYRFSPARS